MNIKLRTFIPTTLLGVLSLNSCMNKTSEVKHPLDIAKTYMKEKTFNEYKEVTASNNPAYIQSKLDSVAYRDLFFTTRYHLDSSNVAKFNKIASSMRKYPINETNEDSIKQTIINTLQKENISLQDYQDITENYKDQTSWQLQHKTDSWKYKQFFKQFRNLRFNRGFVCQFFAKEAATKP